MYPAMLGGLGFRVCNAKGLQIQDLGVFRGVVGVLSFFCVYQNFLASETSHL